VLVHPLVHDDVERVEELDHLHRAASLRHETKVNHGTDQRSLKLE
jgi:hypothetical protein